MLPEVTDFGAIRGHCTGVHLFNVDDEFGLRHRHRAREIRFAAKAYQAADAAHVVCVPVRRNDQVNALPNVDTECTQVLLRYRSPIGSIRRIDARVNDDPATRADVHHDAFPEAWAEKRNLEFVNRRSGADATPVEGHGRSLVHARVRPPDPPGDRPACAETLPR